MLELQEQVGEAAVWFVAGAWWIVPTDPDAPVIVPDRPPPWPPPHPN